MKRLVQRFLALFVIVGLVTAGCVGVSGNIAKDASVIAPNAIPQMIKVLQDVKANKLIAVVAQDSRATRARVEQVLSPKGSAPDPLKYKLALMCPDATDAIGASINETIDGMVAALQAIQAPPDPSSEQGYLMLALTTLKYFPGKSPQDQFADLKAKFSVQLDALFAGCAHLFPKKQFNELVALLGKFGALGATGGAAAPFLPFIQALP